jgi:hypothetical protein
METGLVWELPATSLAFSENAYVLLLVGVPKSNPELVSVSPDGKLPEASVQW